MSRRTRVTVLLVILAAGVLAWVLYMRPRYVLPILMYHSVNPVALPADRLVITPGAFERQMRFLAERGYRVITVEEAAAFIAQKRSLPKRAVCVTFDDGFKDTYTYAFPILKRYGIRATLFVIVREVGRADRVSWDEVREMSASGSVCIGSHAFGPDPLFKMRSDGDLRHQLVDSKRVLEEQCGHEVAIFSYPEGMFDGKIRQAVIDAGYRAAVATAPGKRYPDDDIFALKRLRISQRSNNLSTFWLNCSGFYTFIREHHKK